MTSIYRLMVADEWSVFIMTDVRKTINSLFPPPTSSSSSPIQHRLRFGLFILPVAIGLLLPERDYVTFGSLLSQIRLSSVCLSVMLVHPTQEVEPFVNISSPLCTLAIL